MNTWNIEGGDGYLSGDQDPNSNSTVSGNRSADGKLGRSIAGNVASTATGMALSQTPVSGVPGMVGMAAGAAGDLARGRDAGTIAKNTGMRGLKSGAGYGLRAIGAPGYVAGPAVSIGMANVMESQKTNPNYGRATAASAIPSLSSMAGGMFGGPLGAMVAGVVADAFTSDSLENGVLGDWTDSRSYERQRDNLEDLDWSRDYTDDYADVFGGGRYTDPVDSAMSGMSIVNEAVSNAMSGVDSNAYDSAMNNFGKPEYDPYDPQNYSGAFGWSGGAFGWSGGGGAGGGGFDSVGSGFGDEAADAASEESGLGSMY